MGTSSPDIGTRERITRVETRQDQVEREVREVRVEVSTARAEHGALVQKFEKLLGRLETLIWVLGCVSVGTTALWWLFTQLHK